MPKPETFLKRKEPDQPMSAAQWQAFASTVLGRPVPLKTKQDK